MNPRAWSLPASVLAIALLLPVPGAAQAPAGDGATASLWSPAELAQAAERDRLRGALWGGGIGLVAGGILGGLSVESDEGDGYGGSLVEGPATAEAVLIGAVAGATIGALLGATVFAPSRRPAGGPAGFSMDPLVSRGGFGVSARLPVAGVAARTVRQ